MNISIKVKKLRDTAIVPKYAHSGDAGMDLYSCDDCIIRSGERQLIGTGIAMALPKGYFASIRDKSGLAYKKGITVLGGVVEYTYRGEYGVVLLNTGKDDFKINIGDKIAQVVISPVAASEVELVDELDETIRGDGAWGSTGGSNI